MLESDDVVGGISRTVERDGWRFDIGGHRFFTKVTPVEALWHEILPSPDDFLLRPRLSRIYYERQVLRLPAAGASTRCATSASSRPSAACCRTCGHASTRPTDQSTFEGWTAARFGWRLYRIFFKTYTEKVWGVPADQLQADWAAQRIKNLSLCRARC